MLFCLGCLAGLAPRQTLGLQKKKFCKPIPIDCQTIPMMAEVGSHSVPTAACGAIAPPEVGSSARHRAARDAIFAAGR
jgi:hypothetical protein